MFLWFMQPDIWLTLITLTFLEIILGVDNIIFLSLVVAKLPLSQQNMARKLGLSCAGNDSNLLIVFYVQIMPDDFVMQLHRF